MTNSTAAVKEEDVFTLQEGQIFGEERFIEIFQRREHAKANNKSVSEGVVDNMKSEIVAPFTIKCVSQHGELYKLTASEFEKITK